MIPRLVAPVPNAAAGSCFMIPPLLLWLGLADTLAVIALAQVLKHDVTGMDALLGRLDAQSADDSGREFHLEQDLVSRRTGIVWCCHHTGNGIRPLALS